MRENLGIKEIEDLQAKIPIFLELFKLASEFENTPDDTERKRIAVKMQYLLHKGGERKNKEFLAKVDTNCQIFRVPYSFLELIIRDRESGKTFVFCSERFLSSGDYYLFQDLSKEHYWTPLNKRYKQLYYGDCPVPFKEEFEQLLQQVE